ncbi:hypothetical protein U5A82_14510 [Sphingobium sp. CR2-8]|uniref:hypothetical protein n=1 Tax=Sphingobium sp. CR2-8 TaxID=1306534 RepID=UPI002DB94C72|nr:hypothetical protein [Sphingobium sp. CR2-8]MEC3911635.1 hypothetical protein [Sphingobium sp. CR2-8]
MKAQLMALLEARAALRRARIAAALGDEGVTAGVEGEAVRASAPRLSERWWRDLALREAGRGRP